MSIQFILVHFTVLLVRTDDTLDYGVNTGYCMSNSFTWLFPDSWQFLSRFGLICTVMNILEDHVLMGSSLFAASHLLSSTLSSVFHCLGLLRL